MDGAVVKGLDFQNQNYALFRAVMGMNMLIHGGGRLFGDYSGFIEKMTNMFSNTFLPEFLVKIGANLISPIEFVFGLLLLVGLKTKLSILILNFNMLMLISGVCLLQKWDLAGLQMGYVLYLFFLGKYIESNAYSVDSLILRER
ncbi:MAG: DoxX family protein [Halobacteriovoraceae bacterium]|nr:DoxX family protein [Halobacteriovoraceae bacterium]|tara:strand:+ start:5377 stop:5808 length:432 start_codon:yes stop_codon:yes gene_type:complete